MFFTYGGAFMWGASNEHNGTPIVEYSIQRVRALDLFLSLILTL